jgi:DNA polymerase-3 subunit epsilon
MRLFKRGAKVQKSGSVILSELLVFLIKTPELSFAIVDIETTGGYAQGNGIIEFAVILYNGQEIEGKYETLINPGMPIPRYISSLTGITNEMLYDAPTFAEVAACIYNLLKGRIFVAHNVNFDYSFVKHQLKEHGFDLDCKRLCTVRLSKKVFPGFLKYSLGSICRELNIVIYNRHRAYGDAAATVELFSRVLRADKDSHVKAMLTGRNKHQYLPPHLPVEEVERLPEEPGVYYFHDAKGRVIYVGKARNLQQRVKSHFSNNDGGKRKQDFLRTIYKVSHQVCASEIMALILESAEIRRIWPLHNRSQKRFQHTYGLYSFEDQNGYIRLAIEKKRKHLQPFYTFNLVHEGYSLLRKLVNEFGLDEGLCFFDRTGTTVSEAPAVYNIKVKEALHTLTRQLPTFAVAAGEKHHKEQGYILIEKGRFYGMGYISGQHLPSDLEALKSTLTPYPDNDYIRGLVYQYVEKHPHRKVSLTA